MSALWYVAVGASVVISGTLIIGIEEKRDAVYHILWDSSAKRLSTISVLAATALLITMGDADVKIATEKGLCSIIYVAQVQVLCAASYMLLKCLI